MERLFVLTKSFESQLKLFSLPDELLLDIEQEILKDLSRSFSNRDSLSGTGGFTKIRVAIKAENRGKSGSARVIYFDCQFAKKTRTGVIKMGSKKQKVTKENFEELLLESAAEALDYIKEDKEFRTSFASLIEEPPQYSKNKIRKIRNDLGVSQSIFAKIFGESVSAIQHWEQGRRNMSKSARRILNMIERDSKAVIDLITKDEAS